MTRNETDSKHRVLAAVVAATLATTWATYSASSDQRDARSAVGAGAGARYESRRETGTHEQARALGAQGTLAAQAAPAPGDTLTFEQVLARQRVLGQKAVPHAAERSELTGLLGNARYVREARDRLLAAPTAGYSHEDEEQRLDVVSYLTDALRYRANPAHQQVIEVMREVILAGNHRDAIDPRQKRSLAGDKVLLFVALARLEPNEARDLVAVGDSENHKLLAYAAQLSAEELQQP